MSAAVSDLTGKSGHATKSLSGSLEETRKISLAITERAALLKSQKIEVYFLYDCDVSELTENKEHRCLMPYRSIVSAAILIALCAGQVGASAYGREKEQEEHDEDRARAAVQSGEVLPLEQVLAQLRGGVTGEVSSIELEKEGGIWVYEFKVISPHGRMMEVSVDAKTGKLIEKKGE